MWKIHWWTFKEHAPEKITGFPTGTRVYKGFQGSGKTLSMVHYCLQVMKEFPDCLVFSNIKMNHERVIYFSTNDELEEILNLSPGDKGCLLLLDEAHLFFNKKRGISLDFLAAISQQRKNRFRIIMSSQIWEELDISLRKQVKEIVNCRSLFRTLIVNEVYDGETLTYDKKEGGYTATKRATEIFHMTKSETSVYDTYQRISRNDEYSPSISRPIVSSNTTPVTQIDISKALPGGK